MSEKLGFTIQASMQVGNSEIDKLITNLKKAGNEIISVQSKVNLLKNNANTVIQYSNGVNKVTKTVDNLGNTIKQTTTQNAKAFDTGKLLFYGNMLRMVWNKFKSVETEAVNFNETTEKFNVSMGSSVAIATSFQNKLADAFGTSRADMMNYQSSFKNIMGGMGTMSSAMAEKVSESLTKMSLDYSSLFNISQSSASTKFQSALVGSIMPIRKESGYDVSKNAVSQKAESLGVTTKYANLNETEKRLLRIMLLMDQMKNTGAFEDLSRTIESPSNQLKVLQNQLQELQIWLGNAFIGTIGKILPYINGFVMALKELAKMFAIFVGYEPIATGTDDVLQSASDSTSTISDNLGTASDNAKALKKQLMGFDVLNVITTPTKTSSSGGGSGLTAIDPKILSALSDYNSLMDGVKMKATSIRDSIMEWLGFTKKINPLTGEVSWALKDGFTNLQKIELILGIIAGLALTAKIIKLIGYLKNMSTVFSGGIPKLNSFQSGLQYLSSGFAKASTSTGSFASKVTTAIAPIAKVVSIIGGAILVVKGAISITDSYNKILTEQKNNTLKVAAASVSMAAGGALIGAAFGGPMGAAIGLVAGSIASLVTNIIGYNKVMTDFAKSQLFGTLTISTEDWTTALVNGDTAFSQYEANLKTYQEEMSQYNDNFLKAYNSLDLYTTKFSLASSKITSEDITNIKNSIKSIGDDAISMVQESTDRSLQLWSDTFQSSDNTIDNGEQQILSTIQKYGESQKSTIKDAQDNISTTYSNAIKTRGYLTDQERIYIEQQLAKIKELTDKSMSTSQTDMSYWVNYTSDQVRKSGEDVLNITQESYKNFKDASDQYLEDKKKASSDRYNEEVNNANQIYDFGKTNQEAYNTMLKAASDERTKTDKEADDMVSNYKDQLFAGLYKKYAEVSTKTDDNSKAMKKVLEDTFTDADIDMTHVYAQMITGGGESGRLFEEKLKSSGYTNTSDLISNDGLSQDASDDGKDYGSTFRSTLTANAYTSSTDLISTDTGDAWNKGHELGKSLGEGTQSGFRSYLDLGKLHFTNEGIKWYATGGLPNVGQMFVAREAGPELVGNIGNSSAVVNNQQIVQSVSQGVAAAVKAVLGTGSSGSYNFYLDGNQLTATVEKRIKMNSNMRGD